VQMDRYRARQRAYDQQIEIRLDRVWVDNFDALLRSSTLWV